MKAALLITFLFTSGAGYLFRWLNLRHLRRFGTIVPGGFEGFIDQELMARACSYTLAQSRVGIVASLADDIILVVFLFCGVLGAYDRWVLSFGGSFIVSSVLFYLGLFLAETVVDLPLSLITTFRIESRYGFNTTTIRLWLADLIKSLLLGVLLLGAVAIGALAIVQWSPVLWWLWIWLFFALTSLFLMYLYPYVIEPLYNKFEPLQAEGLEEEIRAMLARAGVSVSRVLQVDASRRSRHANAYFTGIGHVKRIVLYDTLLRQMGHGEILAILAHEVGHWKKGHIWKRLVLTEAGGLAVCYAGYRLLEWGGLPGLLGLNQASFAAQTVILAFIGSLAAFLVNPLSSWLSRRHEYQADAFACELTGAPQELAKALMKLSRDNLANLHPHPLYAAFYYSHPPVVERVKTIQGEQSENLM